MLNTAEHEGPGSVAVRRGLVAMRLDAHIYKSSVRHELGAHGVQAVEINRQPPCYNVSHIGKI